MNQTLAGFDTLRLTRRFGLPLHLYDARQIAENLRAFQTVFKESRIGGRVCYAVKACGHEEIIKGAARAGTGADVASEYELAKALEAGFDRGALSFTATPKARLTWNGRWRWTL